MIRKIILTVTLLAILGCIQIGSACAASKKKTNEKPFDLSAESYSYKNVNSEVNLYRALDAKKSDFIKSEI